MKLVPFLVAVTMLAYAGWTKAWYDLAWAGLLILLVGFDAIVIAINAASTRGAQEKP